MKVAVIGSKEGRMPLGKIFTQILNLYQTIEAIHLDLKEIWQIKESFDLYLRVGDDNYEDIPSHLHPVVWWINDTHLKKSYKKIKKIVKNYDFIFCAQKEGAECLERETKKSTYWIPWGVDEVCLKFGFPQEKEKIWDICFIGTTGKYSLRKVVLEIIKINYPNSFVGRARYSEIFDYYRKAKIVINYSINNDINARLFEAMGAGAMVITHRIKDNGFDKIFKEKEHLVVFDDIFKDMKEKIDYYLRNREEREKIAKKGFEYVRKNHTYRHRLREMFEIMGYKLE